MRVGWVLFVLCNRNGVDVARRPVMSAPAGRAAPVEQGLSEKGPVRGRAGNQKAVRTRVERRVRGLPAR